MSRAPWRLRCPDGHASLELYHRSETFRCTACNVTRDQDQLVDLSKQRREGAGGERSSKDEPEPEATVGATDGSEGASTSGGAGREHRRAERGVPSIPYTAPSRGEDPRNPPSERLRPETGGASE